MKFIGIVLVVLLASGCSPSLIKKNVDENLKISYEISKEEESDIKNYAMKVADSLLNLEINKHLDSENSLRNTHLKVYIDELKWYCPDRSKIEAQGFAAGLAGGLIGASIWGANNFTTVYGISNVKFTKKKEMDSVDVNSIDTISFQANYLSYSSMKTKKKAVGEAFKKSIESLFPKE